MAGPDGCVQISISMVAHMAWNGDWAQSLAVPLFIKLQCIGSAPSLLWGGQLLAVRPAKPSHTIACSQT